MSAQNVKIETMFGWVMESLKLVKKNFRGFISACVVTIVLALLLCVPMGIAMMSTMGDLHAAGAMPAPGMPFTGNMTLFFSIYAVTIVISLLLFPPLLIGWFKLCQNIDEGIMVSTFEILKPYRDMQLWMRGMRFALLGFLVYIVILGLFALVFSGAISDFMHQIEAQQLAIMSGAKPAPPSFPFAFMIGYFCFIFLGSFLQLVYMVGFTEISLRSTPVVTAMKMAAQAVLKNALKLLLVLICVGIIFYIAFFIVSIFLILIIGLLSLIHPIAGALAAFVLFIPLILLMYPLIFSGHYFMWKGLLGGSAPALPTSYETTLSV